MAAFLYRLWAFLQRAIFPLVPNFVFRAAVGLFSGPVRRRLNAATRNVEETQRKILLDIVEANKDCAFGKAHNFAEIDSVDDYRARVPIAQYEDLLPYLERMERGEWQQLTSESPSFFGHTSGTTGAQKLIPITTAFKDEVQRSRLIWYRHLALSFPEIFRGPLMIVKTPQILGWTSGGIPYGSVMAAFNKDPVSQEDPASEYQQFPEEVLALEDFETRYYMMLRHGLTLDLRFWSAVNPSTLILLAKKLDEHRDQLIEDLERGEIWAALDVPDALRKSLEERYRPEPKTARRLKRAIDAHGALRPVDAWPKLAGLTCWKAGLADFYLKDFPKYFGELPILGYGYLATEGVFSIPVDTLSNDGVLAVMGHFFEFIDDDDEVFLAHELKAGKSYRVIVTASNGLYRYDINDVVEVTGHYNDAPRLRFVHKGKTTSSITGEKLTEHQVVSAAVATEKATGVSFVGFTVGLVLEEPPHYRLAVEVSGDLDDEAALASAFDKALGEANVEYQGKRESLRLGEMDIVRLAAGSFEGERKRRVDAGSPDAHVKVPHLQAHTELIERLENEV